MTLSKKAKREIRRRKKWYERTEVSRHIAKLDQGEYHYIVYLNPWGGAPTGVLSIAANGELPSEEIAKEVVFRISSYNNLMRFAFRKKLGMRDIVKRPINLMERLRSLLLDYFGEDILETHKLHKELTLIVELADVMINNQPKFNSMYEEIVSQFKEQEQDLLLTEERFEQVYEIVLDWEVLLFKEQKMQLLVHHDLPIIMNHIKGDRKAKRLYKMLKIFHTEKRRKSFERFLKEVIEKHVGDISGLSYSPEDLKRFKELKQKEGTVEFRLNIDPIIRN
ncbi:hypothetical protein [Rossellomorea marisflavi]|uniref:hypothetical protein n=1 Tax=Rossellomorea marisflavi TaxID=189381 RepID=UPI0034581163